jgi:glucose-6-phosphate isomerase
VTDPSLSRLRSLSAHVPSVPLLVDVSRTCLPTHARTSDPLLSEAFPAAFSAMAALEAGAVANPDEGRRVGHYWLRAPELAPEPELGRAIEETVARVKAFAADIHAGRSRRSRAGASRTSS